MLFASALTYAALAVLIVMWAVRVGAEARATASPQTCRATCGSRAAPRGSAGLALSLVFAVQMGVWRLVGAATAEPAIAAIRHALSAWPIHATGGADAIAVGRLALAAAAAAAASCSWRRPSPSAGHLCAPTSAAGRLGLARATAAVPGGPLRARPPRSPARLEQQLAFLARRARAGCWQFAIWAYQAAPWGSPPTASSCTPWRPRAGADAYAGVVRAVASLAVVGAFGVAHARTRPFAFAFLNQLGGVLLAGRHPPP